MENTYKWLEYKGLDVLQQNGGQADFVLSEDGKSILSVNGGYFEGFNDGIRWSIELDDDYMTRKDKEIVEQFKLKGLLKTDEQPIYRLSLSGGEFETVSKAEAYEELTANIKWAYKNADEMFKPMPPFPNQTTRRAKCIQSHRFLYSTDKDVLIRNAQRLRIPYRLGIVTEKTYTIQDFVTLHLHADAPQTFDEIFEYVKEQAPYKVEDYELVQTLNKMLRAGLVELYDGISFELSETANK